VCVCVVGECGGHACVGWSWHVCSDGWWMGIIKTPDAPCTRVVRAECQRRLCRVTYFDDVFWLVLMLTVSFDWTVLLLAAGY